MNFDFDTLNDLRGGEFQDSMKWNRYVGRDVLPLWVADMDFKAPPKVLDALRRRIDHGVFGYTQPWPSLVAAVVDYVNDQYGWSIQPEWIVWLPGLVTGLNVSCRAVDGEVVTATPIYPPFLSAPRLAGRRLMTVPLVATDSGWQWDFDALEAALTPECRLLLLCHPHNPVGRAWRDDELRFIVDIAERRNLMVCSDEIHCDLLLDGRRHRPFACLDENAGGRSITLMAPSKTFNVPGLGCAFAIVANTQLRRNFKAAMEGIVPHVNALGLVACEAALRHGGAWRRELLEYLRGNRDLVMATIHELPGLRMTPVEATYLAWIDCRESGIEHPQRFFEAAGVGLSAGRDFGLGDDYQSFVRLNFGCPRATLMQALERMRLALRRPSAP
jgi:cysteine-S-conjugate beta-lyase